MTEIYKPKIEQRRKISNKDLGILDAIEIDYVKGEDLTASITPSREEVQEEIFHYGSIGGHSI